MVPTEVEYNRIMLDSGCAHAVAGCEDQCTSVASESCEHDPAPCIDVQLSCDQLLHSDSLPLDSFTLNAYYTDCIPGIHLAYLSLEEKSGLSSSYLDVDIFCRCVDSNIAVHIPSTNILI